MDDYEIEPSAPAHRQEWPVWALDELREIATEWLRGHECVTNKDAENTVADAERLMRALYPRLP